jgi:hypothetical protein
MRRLAKAAGAIAIGSFATCTGVRAEVAPGLYLSEVAANYRTNGVAWVEVFNNTTQPISLAKFKLRTMGLIINEQEPKCSDQPKTFELPDRPVPAGGYHVLAGRVVDYLEDSETSTYIKDKDGYVPYWTAHCGFVELLSVADGKTVDFVRFGNATTAPKTKKAAAWSGENVKFDPDTVEYYVPSESPDPLDNYDQSIVRLSAAFHVTHTKDDWTQVKFPTPGGPNDVPAEAEDHDGDGIPNTAKMPGGRFAGLNLYDMGARIGQRDLFIHVDYMKSEDPGVYHSGTHWRWSLKRSQPRRSRPKTPNQKSWCISTSAIFLSKISLRPTLICRGISPMSSTFRGAFRFPLGKILARVAKAPTNIPAASSRCAADPYSATRCLRFLRTLMARWEAQEYLNSQATISLFRWGPMVCQGKRGQNKIRW